MLKGEGASETSSLELLASIVWRERSEAVEMKWSMERPERNEAVEIKFSQGARAKRGG